MDSMHSESFAIVFIVLLTVVPTIAYLAVRLFGARQAASDHPVVHHH